MQLKENAILQSGKYRIIRVLGQGGFGITYLAHNSYFNNLVAIKEFFPKDFCGRDNTNHLTISTQSNAEIVVKLKARFLKEATNITKLNHPGIVKIHDIFEENNTAYFVMDYIEGENLNELVKRTGPLSESKAIEYICKVGEALEYIHSRNMTHLDVKPANIVLRKRTDQPILIDFGLSKQYDVHGDATSTLMPAVSYGYSPIELYSFKGIITFSPQTDVYSLGATLLFLLTGEIPPAATEVSESGLKLPAYISRSTCNAIKQSMNTKRTKRFASSKLFYQSLYQKTSAKTNNNSAEQTSKESDTSLIQSFQIKTEPPYYVNDEIELFWMAQKCDQIYLNGRLQFGLRKTKVIRYDSPGRKRLTLKAVQGKEESSRTLNFEVLAKADFSKDAEATRMYESNRSSKKEPTIHFFKTSTTEKIHVGDVIQVKWHVTGADTLLVNGERVHRYSTSRYVKMYCEGETAITLTAMNAEGSVSKTIYLNVENQDPPVIKKFKTSKNLEEIYVGDEIPILWEVTGAESITVNGERLSKDTGNKFVNGEQVSKDTGSKFVKVPHEGDTAIVLTATNSAGTVRKTININVQSKNPPVIRYFRASKESNITVGENITLSWDVENCDSVSIDGIGNVPHKGTRTLTFDSCKLYPCTLRASNRFDTVSKSFYLSVDHYQTSQSAEAQSCNQRDLESEANQIKKELAIGGDWMTIWVILLAALISMIPTYIIIQLSPSRPTILSLLMLGLLSIIFLGLSFWLVISIFSKIEENRIKRWKQEHPDDPRSAYL